MKADKLKRRATIAVLGVCVAIVLEASAASAQVSTADSMKMIDTGGDGTINLTEAKFAAAAVIVKIDGNHDGVLSNEELGGRATAVDKVAPSGRFMFWKTEGTLTKQEYLDLVEGKFKPATPDEDGTLDAKELETEQGQALLKLLQ
jgi:hypothetical protein